MDIHGIVNIRGIKNHSSFIYFMYFLLSVSTVNYFYCRDISIDALARISRSNLSSIPSTLRPVCQPQSSYVFIKIHKAGSTTLIAPFQKYAYIHNITMMVPALNNIHLSWPYKFTPNKSNMVAPAGRQFQALVNHVVYNKEAMRSVMDPAAQYITVVRQPVPHLISAYQYFSVNKDNQFLRVGPEVFEKFLSDPVQHDPVPNWMKCIKDSQVKSLTRNLQSADLGLHYDQFDNTTAVDEFITDIEKDFSLIVILERLSESLVLLKRKFCWKIEDILHVNKNIQKTQWHWDWKNISAQSMAAIYKWNNVDTRLYSMAIRKLDEVKRGELRLEEEIKVYNDINSRVSQYCSGNIKYWQAEVVKDPLVIEETPFNDKFIVDRQFCVLLLIKEEDFTLLHKCRLYPEHHQCAESLNFTKQYKLNIV